MAVVEPMDADVGGRRRQRLLSPATLEPVGEIEVHGAVEVRGVVERARKAQPEWGALRFDERRRCLLRALQALVARREAALSTLVGETGKPRTEALHSELAPACDALAWYARSARRLLGDRTLPLHRQRRKRVQVRYRPRGVVGVLTPWSYPFWLAVNPTVQALMAGNAVVLKPSEAAPFSARLLVELLHEGGVPEDVVQCVTGDADTGAALVEGGVDMVAFAGRTRTGRAVGEACGRRLLPCVLALGAKNPMVVCGDADLDRAAGAAVRGAFANAGQTCLALERVYAVDEVADAFTRKVVERTAPLRQGTGGESDVGPLIHAPQLAVVQEHVEDARRKGAKLLAGGRRNPAYPGLFYEPTVLGDATHDMQVLWEETLGPVLPIVRVRDEEEAVGFANETPYGLGASVWTKDRRRGARLARQLETGAAVVNDVLLHYAIPEAPYGGRKQSGVGRLGGEVGLKQFCDAQTLVADRLGAGSEFAGFPYTERKARRLARRLRLTWGSPLGRFL